MAATKPRILTGRGSADMDGRRVENPASEIIRLRVTPDDKAALQSKAEKAELSLSAYLIRVGLRRRFD